MSDDRSIPTIPLPLVIQVGFAGSRRLIDLKTHPGINVVDFEERVKVWLADRLRQLRIDLGLEEGHFFCGISAIAVGGDTVFTKACLISGISQRVFLPQTRDEFLNAAGSSEPDFTADQKREAAGLLESPHVIQERLVSDARTREARFEDVNREIARVSDVCICLLREVAVVQPGGTEDLITRAVQRGKPVLVIRVGVAEGKPVFKEEWRLPEKEGVKSTTPKKAFALPTLPGTLAMAVIPKPGDGSPVLIAQYAAAVKHFASPAAGQMQRQFTRLAKSSIGAHIVATILATVALAFGRKLQKVYLGAIIPLLVLELLMLIGGYIAHLRLHRKRAAHRWAEARLLAEIARSVIAVGNLHVYLEHLFALPFPPQIRPLLRTMNVLHLRSTRHDSQDWKQKRDTYIQQRLTQSHGGQKVYYRDRAGAARRRLARLNRGFFAFWSIAVASTLLKLILDILNEEDPTQNILLIRILGTLAIVMPVLAAACLSLAAALDLEAQGHTYREMFEFLDLQEKHLMSAMSERDYAKLVVETESHLLGETANWFSRRSFTGVS
jgi:hypothetical protein